jgi:hypothetical protein
MLTDGSANCRGSPHIGCKSPYAFRPGGKTVRGFLMSTAAVVALGLLPGCDAVDESICAQDGVVSTAVKNETFFGGLAGVQNWEKTWATVARPANLVRDIVVERNPINGDPATYCSATYQTSINIMLSMSLADGRFDQNEFKQIVVPVIMQTLMLSGEDLSTSR